MFGQGSRDPVAITALVRNPNAAQEGCRILYRDIGDYLTREEKLTLVREWGSIAGILNHPNGWFEDPRDLVAAFRRIVQVSVETVAVVESLPCPFFRARSPRGAPVTSGRPSSAVPSRNGYAQRRAPRRASSSATRASAARRAAASSRRAAASSSARASAVRRAVCSSS